MTCLLAIAPSSYHYHHARLGVDKYAGLRAEVAGAFAASKGRYGYRRIKAVLKTGVSEKVIRRIMAEDGLVAHAPKGAGDVLLDSSLIPSPPIMPQDRVRAAGPVVYLEVQHPCLSCKFSSSSANASAGAR